MLVLEGIKKAFTVDMKQNLQTPLTQEACTAPWNDFAGQWENKYSYGNKKSLEGQLQEPHRILRSIPLEDAVRIIYRPIL